MNKEWYERKKKEAQHDIEVAAQMTRRFIEEDKNLYDADKEYLIQLIEDCKYLPSNDFTWLVDMIYGIRCINKDSEFKNLKLGFDVLSQCKNSLNNLKNVLDSQWIDIEGDVVITDPCYTTDEWCDDFLYELPLCRDTIYGDWSCTTFDKKTKEIIGEFCADAGMVCVDTLDNILERKPNFLEEYGEWCRTIIKNFKGKVRFKIICRNEKRDNEKFNMWNYEVRVEGEGINSVTGDDIQFITSQTGL